MRCCQRAVFLAQGDGYPLIGVLQGQRKFPEEGPGVETSRKWFYPR